MASIAILLGPLMMPLVIGTIVNRLAQREVVSVRLLGNIGISLLFCVTGAGHFFLTDPMARMLPPWVPQRVLLVYVTGVMELAVAVTVLVPRLRRVTGIGMIAMLVAFLPVNVYAALHRVPMGGHAWGLVYLWLRVPLQVIVVGWIWWFAVRVGGKSAE